MSWKVVLRPLGLPVLLLSLVVGVFFPPAIAVGAIFYGGAVYWAYHRERNRALPPGTVDEVSKLPYRRRKLANHAIAAARDIERRLSLLPKDMVERMPLTADDAGRLAAAVVYYLREEAEARKLAKAGGGKEAEEAAKRAAAGAEQTFSRVQSLQSSLAALALSGAHVDREMLAADAEEAAEGIRVLRRAMEEARAELTAADERLALEGRSDAWEGGEGY